MAGIFINYRREDSSGVTGRLADKLKAHFGEDQIFRDIDTIKAGADFVEAIHQALSSCSALLAIIGPQWISATDKQGRRRLDDPQDYTRLEISAAFVRNIPVIPVLVDGASMPGPDQLPDDIVMLSRRQAIELGDKRWTYDTGQLIAALELLPDLKAPAKKRATTGLLATLHQALAFLPSYLNDLMAAVTRPKSFIAERNTGKEGDLKNCLVFLGITVFITAALQAPLQPKHGLLTAYVNYGLRFLLLVISLSGILRLSWRIVGGKAEFTRFLITFSYYAAVILLGLVCATLALFGILHELDPQLYTLLQKTGETGDWRTFLQADPFQRTSFIAATIGYALIVLLTVIWGVAGWGAFRELNGLSRLRSTIALILTAVFSVPLLVLYLAIANTL